MTTEKTSPRIGVDAEHVQWWIQLEPEAIQKISYDEIKRLRRYKLPDYLTSRDAIVSVIEKQSEKVKDAIVYDLATDEDGVWYSDRILFATPSQLSEALLRATGKWSEE